MRHCFLWLMVCGLLIGVLAAACDSDGDDGGPGPTSTGVASPTATGPPFPFEGPIGIDLTTYGTFHNQGEPVRLTIAVAVSEPITLYYRTTQRYDIVVADEAGNEVWRWSKDKAFGEVVEQVRLETNGVLTFDESWDQRDNNGKPVAPGNYTVTATSTDCDAKLGNCGQLSVSHTIQIRAS